MNDESTLRSKYEKSKPALKVLGDWVMETILDELKSQLGSCVLLEKFLQIPPKPRVKETDSFLEKIIRKPKEDPFQETTDQVGVRFVVLLLEDVNRIGSIIQSVTKWHWSKDRDYEQERLKRPDYFSYQSDHYIVRNKESFSVAGIAVNAGTPCEIQVRTLLQHAYAEMAHSSDYKPSVELLGDEKKHVRRALAKGSALIETTDEVFREIKNRFNDYNESLKALLVQAAQIYTVLTEEVAPFPTILGEEIADQYRELLSGLKPQDLEAYMAKKKWFGDTIKNRREVSVFYRDSIVILLFWLVHHHRFRVREFWPIDMSYLEEFMLAAGISTEQF